MSDTSSITTGTRIGAGLLAVYLALSSLGILTAADMGTDVGDTVWAVWLAVAAAALAVGLVIVKPQPLAGTVTLCGGALLAIGAYFWFTPLWLVALFIVAGAVWSYRSEQKATTPTR